uniref:Transcription factor CBF/NF-Y/archaeal histone domain-containing protein n=1 Tax=Amorphochlora amoebiformis TaxID=1561963 RepID=A0A7S0CZQ6_9EUKA|mmetsp:Transcript_16430/g.26025  ORF Transcript_16430/g.26025 Transcript_16430/m.26025 type:complete len:262 (+) Transcript_16430:40-825(+)
MSKRKSETSLRGDDQSQKFKHERQRQAYIDNMHNFWQKQLDKIKNTDFKNLKQHDLPLARIKKIMRSDEDVKMISAEAPVLFAKACELFILDLTMRAWSHADANRRRTLQREDVAAAISDSDMFDFLLDVVPRQTVDQNKESIDSSAVAQLASKNAQVGSEELEPSDHRLRRPILNPLTPNQTPIDMIMPVPVDSKSQDQTSLEHLPGCKITSSYWMDRYESRFMKRCLYFQTQASGEIGRYQDKIASTECSSALLLLRLR